MEDIDGGLHPAVDGQSLDEDEDEGIDTRFFQVVRRAIWNMGIDLRLSPVESS